MLKKLLKLFKPKKRKSPSDKIRVLYAGVYRDTFKKEWDNKTYKMDILLIATIKYLDENEKGT